MSYVFKCLLVTLLVVSMIGCVRPINLQAGITSFRIQNYREAFIRLKPEAIKGQPDAEYAVGYMYYYGQGIVEDHEQALMWISQAARAGQPDAIAAMTLLGGK